MSMDQDRIARVEALFAGWGEEGPGGALTLLRGGEVVLERRFGRANIEHAVPVAATTRFHIASVTKTFVGAACALLHHQGRLDLDGDITGWIPELRPQTPMTLRHLLTMTSGLRDSMESMVLRGTWFRYPRSSQDLLDLIFAQTTQCWPTGQRWVYTNINFNLAALVIERVSGQAFDAFLAEHFWQPLGMHDTLLRDSNTQSVPKLADAYVPAPEGWQKGTWAFGLSGAGGLVSTVEDLVRWQGMFRQGGLHGAKLVELMSTRGLLTSGERPQYGLGLMVRPYRGATVLHHSGGLPGYKAMFARVPEHDFGMVLLSNRDDADPGGLLRRVVDICLDDALDPPRPVTVAVPQEMAGRYLDPVSGEVVTVSVDAAEGVAKLEKLGATLNFRPDGEGGLVDGWAHFMARLRPAEGGALALAFGGQAGVFAPVAPYVPAEVADILGLYRNAVMRSEVEILQRDGAVLLRLGPAFHREAELAMEPIAEDVWLAVQRRPWGNAQYAVRVQRHAGAVEGLLISSDRLKDAKFLRL
jgi:CubicO group peptidase (beta-lactamase class C family)